MDLGWVWSSEVAAPPDLLEEASAEPDRQDPEEAEFKRRLAEYRLPWPVCSKRNTVVSLLLSLRDVSGVDLLEVMVRALLAAPHRPVLLRVLLPTEAAAHELGARFRGELRPSGLRHRVRDRCLLIAEEAESADGSHQLLDLAPPLIRRAVNSMVLVHLPSCFGVWDTLVRVGLPAGATREAADSLVHEVGVQVGVALDPQTEGHGAVSRQLLLASEPGGRNPRLYRGSHPTAPAAYLGSWQAACSAVGLGVVGDDLDKGGLVEGGAPGLLVAGWLDRAP